MRPWLPIVALTALLLGGCASVVQNDVVAFHEWPADLQDKSYVFDHRPKQPNNLEYQRYQGLVAGELHRLGFTPAANLQAANLKVAFDYTIDARDVTVVQPVYGDPYWPYWYGIPYYGRRWRGHYSPFHDPFWPPGPVITGYQESQYQVYQRHLVVTISRGRDGKKLYEVSVDSSGGNGSLAFAMPYMVRAAFRDFPGKSGVPHRVNLKIDE